MEDMPMVDVMAKLEALAAEKPMQSNWKQSIADLLFLLEIDHSYENRVELAMMVQGLLKIAGEGIGLRQDLVSLDSYLLQLIFFSDSQRDVQQFQCALKISLCHMHTPQVARRVRDPLDQIMRLCHLHRRTEYSTGLHVIALFQIQET